MVGLVETKTREVKAALNDKHETADSSSMALEFMVCRICIVHPNVKIKLETLHRSASERRNFDELKINATFIAYHSRMFITSDLTFTGKNMLFCH